MIIAYYSRTCNVRDFVHWYLIPALGDGYHAKNIEEWDADEPYILVTPTYDFGEIPDRVRVWLEQATDDTGREFGGSADEKQNSYYVEGVIGSGNKNFGNLYAQAADKINQKYGAPIVGRFELKGSEDVAEDIRTIIREAYE